MRNFLDSNTENNLGVKIVSLFRLLGTTLYIYVAVSIKILFQMRHFVAFLFIQAVGLAILISLPGDKLLTSALRVH